MIAQPGFYETLWKNSNSRATTFINHQLHHGDNRLVVGYDNQHGYHHRHYFGRVKPIEFVSFEEVEERFEQDWLTLRQQQ